ncbi:MAG: exodeoxyribonuclease VII small subunit [Spirochaetaceae bacterium]
MKSFEERLERLEELVAQIRGGDVSLDEAVGAFEEGIKLAKSLERDLSKVERRIEILVNEPDNEDEKPALELFPELEELRDDAGGDEG